ncbi:hypothetical protein ETAE_2290 [Edwardsiella piscicida]|uniref:Uncharacterized protein n=1 Tax=Edwardsiella piscicida TaxID=1263550 RepID=A0AAU8PKE3_EDWPI|nr:hypothetical protein ETAE_2290 [Edwardsiella tarda EIB202]
MPLSAISKWSNTFYGYSNETGRPGRRCFRHPSDGVTNE